MNNQISEDYGVDVKHDGELMHLGFTYNFSHPLSNGNSIFKCIRSGCPGSIIVKRRKKADDQGRIYKFVQIKSYHEYDNLCRNAKSPTKPAESRNVNRTVNNSILPAPLNLTGNETVYENCLDLSKQDQNSILLHESISDSMNKTIKVLNEIHPEYDVEELFIQLRSEISLIFEKLGKNNAHELKIMNNLVVDMFTLLNDTCKKFNNEVAINQELEKKIGIMLSQYECTGNELKRTQDRLRILIEENDEEIKLNSEKEKELNEIIQTLTKRVESLQRENDINKEEIQNKYEQENSLEETIKSMRELVKNTSTKLENEETTTTQLKNEMKHCKEQIKDLQKQLKEEKYKNSRSSKQNEHQNTATENLNDTTLSILDENSSTQQILSQQQNLRPDIIVTPASTNSTSMMTEDKQTSESEYYVTISKFLQLESKVQLMEKTLQDLKVDGKKPSSNSTMEVRKEDTPLKSILKQTEKEQTTHVFIVGDGHARNMKDTIKKKLPSNWVIEQSFDTNAKLKYVSENCIKKINKCEHLIVMAGSNDIFASAKKEMLTSTKKIVEKFHESKQIHMILIPDRFDDVSYNFHINNVNEQISKFVEPYTNITVYHPRNIVDSWDYHDSLFLGRQGKVKLCNKIVENIMGQRKYSKNTDIKTLDNQNQTFAHVVSKTRIIDNEKSKREDSKTPHNNHVRYEHGMQGYRRKSNKYYNQKQFGHKTMVRNRNEYRSENYQGHSNYPKLRKNVFSNRAFYGHRDHKYEKMKNNHTNNRNRYDDDMVFKIQNENYPYYQVRDF
uniref:Uncharacterized protein n=1 Tax=Cacopsylla melanoneura TaxID=428564 RepID=A0A8D8XHW3_9HEMI